jgi:predicted nucleic acid-binding protein
MFLDTSGLLCLLDRRDPLRPQAAQFYAQATLRISHSFVLAELVALGNTRKLPSDTVLSFVGTLISRPEAEIIWVDEQLTAQALILLKTRRGAGYSLCDAVSFVLMRQRDVTAALTADSDFEQEGFQRLLA